MCRAVPPVPLSQGISASRAARASQIGSDAFATVTTNIPRFGCANYYYFNPQVAGNAAADRAKSEYVYDDLIRSLDKVLKDANFDELPHEDVADAHRKRTVPSKSRQSTRHALAVASASSKGHLVCGCGNCQIDHDHCDRSRQTREICDGDDETPHVRGGVRCRCDDAYAHCARSLETLRKLRFSPRGTVIMSSGSSTSAYSP